MKNCSNKCKKIRKGDKVVGISGNSRGLTGTVLSCSGDKVLVQGLNIRKKHVKPNQQNQRGGIIELEKPIHVSNLKLCNTEDQPVKVKVRTAKTGQRELVYKVDGREVLHRSLKKS